MSSEGTVVFTKENLDTMLKELAKEFKKRNGTTVPAEYLIAMKLRSGRKYKNDLSDIIGVLAEHERRGDPISKDRIDMAVCNLYGGWDGYSADSISFIHDALERGNYETIYAAVMEEEKNSKDMLVEFGKKYPGVTTQSNVNEILASLKAKKPSIIGQLREGTTGDAAGRQRTIR